MPNRWGEFIDSVVPRLAVAREGWSQIGLWLGLGSGLHWLKKLFPGGWWARTLNWLGNLSLGLGLLSAYAYRDPQREPLGNDPDYFYSPTDGMVVLVERSEQEDLFVLAPVYKIQLRSHLLDVAMQRVPVPGVVQYIHHSQQETGQIGLKTSQGQRLLLTYQINPYTFFRFKSPLTAPTVFIRPQVGQTLSLAQKFAVRSFGRPLLTTLYLPAEGTDILCRAGQHVQAGMTVIGRRKPEIS